ncbi:MAG TPA: tellurite resistance TerB family protein [Rhodobacteraceae bacterium]|nr:tellurite resistance TerB family protein [Paracoccaceae bacterium]
MSLMKTLAKVAIGVAVAKGIGSMASKGRTQQSGAGGGLLDALTKGSGGAATPRSSGGGGGGLEDMLGSILGGGGQQQAGPSAGGLGGLLDGLSDASRPQGGVKSSRGNTSGGLDDLLDGLSNQGGGLGGLLTGTRGGSGGDLGGLLGGLLGAGASAAAPAPKAKSTGKGKSAGKQNSFGDKLNHSLRAGDEPDVPPTPQQEYAAGLMLKAMIQAAKSDGKIDDAERQKLLGQLGDISPEERDFVNAELGAPIDVEGLAQQVPNGMEAQVYAMSVMAIDLDNRNEAQYLHDFATALGLDRNGVNQIHAQLGVPSIYG